MHIDHYNVNNIKYIHIVGIGGIGMSGLAKLLHINRIMVQGSDIIKNRQVEELKRMGINVFLEHKTENILNACLVIKSSAISHNNPELLGARMRGIPVISRAKLLSNIIQTSYNICITGSHGKTSTTSLLYLMLKNIGISPTVICGGIINSISNNVEKGEDNITIVEADESDGTFTVLPTNISIITNISSEHLDYYGTLQNLIKVYRFHINQCLLKDLIVTCDDCVNLKQINKNYYQNSQFITYGIYSSNCDLQAFNIKNSEEGISFDIKISSKGKLALKQKSSVINSVELNTYGIHNIYNCLAALIIYLFKGGKKRNINNILKMNKGVKRRFSKIGTYNDITFIDDYAHHPNEIKATLNTAKELTKKTGGRIMAVFEPHRYSRFKNLYNDFLKAFNVVDYLIVLDIFPAGENSIPGISSKLFVSDVEKNVKNSFYAKDTSSLIDLIKNSSSFGDHIIFMGAGNVSKLANLVFKKLSLGNDCTNKEY